MICRTHARTHIHTLTGSAGRRRRRDKCCAICGFELVISVTVSAESQANIFLTVLVVGFAARNLQVRCSIACWLPMHSADTFCDLNVIRRLVRYSTPSSAAFANSASRAAFSAASCAAIWRFIPSSDWPPRVLRRRCDRLHGRSSESE